MIGVLFGQNVFPGTLLLVLSCSYKTALNVFILTSTWARQALCALFFVTDKWLLFIWLSFLEFYVISARNRLFWNGCQHLISPCLLGKYSPFWCRKRRRSSVMLNSTRPSRTAHIHVWRRYVLCQLIMRLQLFLVK